MACVYGMGATLKIALPVAIIVSGFLVLYI